MITQRRWLIAGMALALIAGSASAQQYPAKPVRMIVPFPAGGAADNVARVVARGLSDGLGQQVLVDNRPGGDGVIAANALLQSPPDGYTLLMGTATGMNAVPALRKTAPYDPVEDFTAISLLGNFTHLLVVHPDVPAQTLLELVAYARANPGQLNYATTNFSAHAGTIQLMRATGISMVHVPYKGSAQSIPDLMTGRVQVSFDSSPALYLPHVKAGRLRILATMMQHRSPLAPDAPTLAESGIEPVRTLPWGGLFGPARLPKPIAERLSRDVSRTLEQPEARKRLDDQAFEPEASAPEQFAAFVRTQLEAWRRIAKEGAMTID
ncbi:MAG TPA: tripartite tricarboxylate transporter substrate binding protein [Burkholderiales bacterium]|nr:tripartite tricarboxylate transporter substrate binding protein [Burkholderiales bacterium]